MLTNIKTKAITINCEQNIMNGFSLSLKLCENKVLEKRISSEELNG
jgi:hypothetical protein